MPAILGAPPIFDRKINIVNPVLPDFDQMDPGIQKILNSGIVTKGAFLTKFEENVSDYLEVQHAIGVSSCTAGLMLVYKTLGLSGEVIVPSFTFMATVSALVWCGLTPKFVDVEPGTTNIDPDEIRRNINTRTSAIVAVHNFGNPAKIIELEEISSNYGLKLIFDAAHGFGASFQGYPVGNQGDVQIFSMSPTKLLITGEGGLIATNDLSLAEAVRMGREYGNNGKYDSVFAGMNARLAEFNALMGIHSLELLENASECRNRNAALYRKHLRSVPGIGFQEVEQGNRCSYKDYSITIDAKLFGLSRDELAVVLSYENIDVRKYYDPPVHRQQAYQHFHHGSPLPNTDYLSRSSLSLPMWSVMEEKIIEGICESIHLAHRFSDKIHDKLG